MLSGLLSSLAGGPVCQCQTYSVYMEGHWSGEEEGASNKTVIFLPIILSK